MPSEKPPSEVTDVRKQLAALIRNDWVFEWPPHNHFESSSLHANGLQPSSETEAAPTYSAIGHAEEWRERTYGSSDTSADEDPGPDRERRHRAQAMGKHVLGKILSNLSAEELEPPLQDQLLRRQQRLEDEISWNPGLAHWTAQRDAWTCAKHVRRSGLPSERLPTAEPNVGDDSSSTPSQPSEPTSPSPPSSTTSTPPSAPIKAIAPLLSPTLQTSTPPSPIAPTTKTLIPVAPPLLPETDPTRASISPRIYPSIFQRVVLQSQAPTVPVNLLHLTRALVEGWKRSGEWPPTPKSPTTTAATTTQQTTKPTSNSPSHKAKHPATSPPAAATTRSTSNSNSNSHTRHGSGSGGSSSLLTLLHDGTASASQRLGRHSKRLFTTRGGEGGAFGNRNVSVAKWGAGPPEIAVLPDEKDEDAVMEKREEQPGAIAGAGAVDAGARAAQEGEGVVLGPPAAFGARSRDVAKRVGRRLRLSLSGGSTGGQADA